MNRMVRLNAIKQDIQASKQDIDLSETVARKTKQYTDDLFN